MGATRLRAALAVALALAGLALAGPQAFAHAVLVEAVPADGAQLDAPPAEVRLRFSEPVRPSVVRVLNPGGALVAGSEAVSAAGETVRIALASALSPGSYVVSYRVISADGHPVSGSTVFGIGAEAARSSREPGEASDAALLAGLSAVNRTVQYGILLGAVGGALFLLLVLGRAHSLETRLPDGLCGLIALAAATSVLAVGLNGAQLTGTPVAGLLTAAPWVAAASTSVQAGAAATLGGLLVLALGLALRRRSLAAGALALGLLLAASSLALTGHAATAPPRALSLPAVFLHGLAAAFWIGSLWPLLIVLRGAPAAEAHVLVARFSRLAVGAVAVLVVAGIVLSVVQIEAPEQILATSYGRIWAVKIGFVALLLGLAALNRRVLTRRLTKAGPHAAAALCRSIAAELVCATSILAATALLGQTPPPRALIARADAGHAHDHAAHHTPMQSRGAEDSASAQGATARLALDPVAPGRNDIVVTLTDAQGRPVAAREVTTFWSLPEAGIEPIERRVTPAGGGRFMGEIDLPAPGTWSVRIDALVSDFDKVIFRTDLAVTPSAQAR